MASNNKKVTADDYSFDDDKEASSFSRILGKTKRENPAKPEPLHEPIMSQSGAKPEPNLSHFMSQSGAKPEPAKGADTKFLSNHEPQPEPLHEPIMSQSGAKPEPNNEFYSLVGLQRNSLLFIFETCLENGSKTSSPISSSVLANSLNSTVAAVRKGIRRLEEKGFVIRSHFKDGRGGWTKYELPTAIYSELLKLKTRANHEPIMSQSGAKRTPQPTPQHEPSFSSSSRGLNFKESTTTQPVDNFARISEIDVAAVQAHGISHSVLLRCVELYPVLKPEHLEVLVSRFAEFMKEPKSKVQNARGFFISLAEQASKGQVPLDHIETPDERLMREFVKLAKEGKNRRELLEKEAFEFAFDEWIESLNSKSRNELVPVSPVIESGSKIQTMKLKEHFRLNIWPSRFVVSKEAEV